MVPGRRLAATRTVGAGVVAWIGQLAVDTPDGLFGRADELTSVGLTFGIGVLTLSVVTAAAYLLQFRFARVGLFLVIGGSMAMFLPPVASDPIVCLGVIGWQLGSGGRTLLEPDDPPVGSSWTPGGGRALEDAYDEWLSRWRPSIEHALIVSVGCTTAVVGFALTHLTLGPISCLVIDGMVLSLVAPLLWRWIRKSGRFRVALVIFIVGLIPLSYDIAPFVGLLGLYQAVLLAVIIRSGPLGADLLHQFLARPALLLMVGFAATCVLGAILLSFPAASAGGSFALIDALFTATSAVCVTGLIVVDTPTAWSGFGQALLLLLIQVGGLGIMVLSTFATVLLGGRLGLRGQHALEEVLEMTAPGQAYRLARFIVLSTLGIEAFGALLLMLSFRGHGLAWSDAAWRGVFHAVSAFCNAGFALQSDSLMMFAADPWTLRIIETLVIAGGLGFVVLAALWNRGRERRGPRTTVQVRVVLWMSAALLALGFGEYALVEWNVSLAGLSVGEKLSNAWFQSVSTRTAGFNSIDLTKVHDGTALTFMGLMFVGASPGGTGGGIKTTTFAVLMAALPAVARGDTAIALFGREILPVTVLRAAAIGLMAVLVALLTTFGLVLTQSHDTVRLAFEAVSALGTVGLSLDVTPTLDTFGKVIVIVAMFLGRIGPVSLALLLARRGTRHIAYPTSRIMVG